MSSKLFSKKGSLGNILSLTIGQALLASGAPLTLFAGGLIGYQLAPTQALSTLPLSFMVIGTFIGALSAPQIMGRIGRKNGFFGSAIWLALCAGLAGLSIVNQNFWGYSISIACIGIGFAFVYQYRFAAAECVEPEYVGKAVSLVILGGIGAAFLGPEMGRQFKDLIQGATYAGSYFVFSGVSVMGAFILWGLYANTELSSHESEGLESRSLGELSRQPLLWVAVCLASIAYGVMTLIMTATPLAMHHHHGISLFSTKLTIQWHVVFMFLPSLISGWLVSALGLRKLGLLGAGIFVCSALVGMAWQDSSGFLLCLILLGIGWNFLFVCSTTLLTRTYKPHEGFRVQSLNEGIVFGFQVVLSLSAGLIIHHLGWVMLNVIALGFGVLGLGIIVVFLKSSIK